MLDEYNRATAAPKEEAPAPDLEQGTPEDDDALLERVLAGALSDWEKVALRRQGVNPEWALPGEIRDALSRDALMQVHGKVLRKVQEAAYHVQQRDLAVQHKIDTHDYRLLIGEFRKAPEFSDKSDEFLEVLVDGAHARSEVFQDAWRNRYAKPMHYERTVRRLIRECVKEMGPVYDPDVTADRLAMAEAVRGASTNTRPPQRQINLNALSDEDFARYTEQQWGYRSRVGG
jgi:hypothetical protein